MKNSMKFVALFLGCGIAVCGCGTEETENVSKTENPDTVAIHLADDGITVDGEIISSDKTSDVYAANDIVFYLEGQDLTYGEGTEADAHSQEEADAHTVVHITRAGTYELSGRLSKGQVAVDLGENAKDDPEAVVTLILNNADITCEVAPAIIFYEVYECGDSSAENAAKDVDTAAAGANIILADGSQNNMTGSYVAKIYESCTLNEEGTEVEDSKKLHKYDGTVYSKMSMNVTGESEGSGILNIKAENEGLCSDLHLTINGGITNIISGNDGINTSEDGVSVFTMNAGEVHVTVSGETGEGDGIDSNGWIVINGGTIVAAAYGDSQDAGIDSDLGTYLNGGNIIASGNMYDRIAESEQAYTVFACGQKQNGNNAYIVKDADGRDYLSVTPANDFLYLIVSDPNLTDEEYTLWNGDTQLAAGSVGESMMHGGPGGRKEFPEGMEPGERPERMKPEELPEGMEPGQGPDEGHQEVDDKEL
ncbi:MAG: carbohydrate-binding domain-containing protein [Lachnospiraceae bacterium]